MSERQFYKVLDKSPNNDTKLIMCIKIGIMLKKKNLKTLLTARFHIMTKLVQIFNFIKKIK